VTDIGNLIHATYYARNTAQSIINSGDYYSWG
jgi:hypothetical protein